jgi:hypothetical protein
MRRGCIAIGKAECDGCHRLLKYGERYLLIEGEGAERQRLCVDCCQSRDYVSEKIEKGNQIITFLSKE